MHYYAVNFKYERLSNSGKAVIQSEKMLIRAGDYAEAEVTFQVLIQGRVKPVLPENYTIVRVKYHYDNVVFNDSKNAFYEVVVAFDEGEGKTSRETVLLPATSPTQAETLVTEWLTDNRDAEITDTKHTSTLGLWDNHSPDDSAWINDFWDRMDDLKADGYKSIDLNQTDIDYDGRSQVYKDLHTLLKKMRTNGIDVSVKGPNDADYKRLI